MASWYHWRGGLYFRRVKGGVAIKRSLEGARDFEFEIPAEEWASIVASVTPQGDTADTYPVALEFYRTGKTG